MNWSIVTLLPNEMMKAMNVASKTFPLGSIAGSVGQHINSTKKPGINEDGGLIAFNDEFILGLLIDGHYHRDTTELLIEQLKHELEINKTNWHFTGLDLDNEDLNPKVYSMTISQRFFDLCKNFIKSVITQLRVTECVGEASFTIFLLVQQKLELHYYHVGDLLFFVSNPNRHWGPAFQVVTRQFYEWINRQGLNGFHHGFLTLHPGSKLILATDGLYDKPTFSLPEIELFFNEIPFSAADFVKYSLKNNAQDEDDNATVICITLPNVAPFNELVK